MIDDFTPIIHRLEGRTIKVWAVADVHIGARECDLEGFERFLKRVSDDDDSYLVICGDLLNNGLKDSLTNVYEEVMPPSVQLDKAVELLLPVKDRILGCVGGNHEARTKKAVDLDPLYAVMLMLGKGELYRSNMAFMRVTLGLGKTRDHYALMLVHGKTANKKKQFAYAVEGVDAIISGHTHDGIVEKPARIVFNTQNRVSVKPLISLTATSWLDYGGYAAASLFQPKSTSNPQALILEYTATNTRAGDIRVVW